MDMSTVKPSVATYGKAHARPITPRTPANKQVPLFHHLPQYEREASLSAAAVAKGNIHPVVLRLGLQMAEGLITGSNARVVAMLRAFQSVISDFDCPPSKVLSRELEVHLSKQIQCAHPRNARCARRARRAPRRA